MPSLPHLSRVLFSTRVRRHGYYATRQSILRNGGNMHDVAWVLTTTLRIQGA